MIWSNFFIAEERFELVRCVRSQREEHEIARYANAILLLDDGESCTQIAKFLYLDDDSIRNWYRSYQRDGWEDLALDGLRSGQSRMTVDREAELCIWFEGRFCHSAGQYTWRALP